VQPSGSGTEASKLFFVEASGSKLVFRLGDKKETVAATEATIIASAPFNYFLTQVAKDEQAQLVFLLRDDGTTAFNRGGGWAQGKYGIRNQPPPRSQARATSTPSSLARKKASSAPCPLTTRRHHRPPPKPTDSHPWPNAKNTPRKSCPLWRSWTR